MALTVSIRDQLTLGKPCGRVPHQIIINFFCSPLQHVVAVSILIVYMGTTPTHCLGKTPLMEIKLKSVSG